MTDFEKFCIAFLVICGIILAAGFSWKIAEKRGYRKGYDAALNLPHKADTIYKTDTHYVDKPVEKIRWKDRLVYIPVNDTIVKNDTTFISLPFEKVQYEDSTYTATVSGFQPKLESITVYQKTAYITNTVVVKKKWSFSITAGPGVVWNTNGFHGGVGAVAGVSYNF